MDGSISLLGEEYTEKFTDERLPGKQRRFAYSFVDVDDSIIWLWNGIPPHLLAAVRAKAQLEASRVHSVLAGAVS
jgi:hypothetical protein